MPHLDPLTEQQLMGICGLQQSSQQAEEALLQGFEQLHHSLADTVAIGLPVNDGTLSYMNYTAVALEKLANLEVFIRQVLVFFLSTVMIKHNFTCIVSYDRSII